MISGVSARSAVTLARHSRGFIASGIAG
jgi:hypothetical protein